jgi:hypothetical protein
MNKSIWKQLTPHAIAIGIFFLVACLYCLPVFKGSVLGQHDTLSWKAMAQQSYEFKEKYGHVPLWTNSMFSGMPTFQIALESKYNIGIAFLHGIFTLYMPQPAGLFFLACIGFYILCLVLGIRPWIAILGSLAYSFASYSAVIVAVGHITKFGSMGYAPAVLAGIILLTQRKYVLGFLTTLVFGTLLFYQNHIQIIYYLFLVIGFMAIAYAVQCIRKKEIKPLLVSAGLAIVAIALSAASFAVVLLPTREYAKETMRGGRSQLTTTETGNKTAGGLDKDYAFGWSYGITETFSLAVPRIYGGSSPTVIGNQYVSEIGDQSKTATVLAEKTGMPEEQANELAKAQFSAYWGDQPGTSGTVYVGAIICFLFIAGLVIYRGWHLSWIIAATILGIVMAWGKNFATLNYFLFDYLPSYNKFRAPTMALIIPQLTVPLLAVLGLNELVSDKADKTWMWKKLKVTTIAAGALVLILGALYFSLSYTNKGEKDLKQNLARSMEQQMSQGKQPTPEITQQANEFGRAVFTALQDDRRSLYGGDLLRTIILMLLTAGLLAAVAKNKLSGQIAVFALIGLTLFDLLGVDMRYLTSKNYMEKEEVAQFIPSRADEQIRQDTSYFRIFDQAGGNPFNDARASYFHNSVGGYHAAKLSLYNDLIQNQLGKGNMKVFNMLNTKYFIVNNPQDRQPIAQQNPEALGAAWLVKTIKYVNNADEEMKALDTFEPRDTAITEKSEQAKIPFAPQYDSAASIRLVKNLNDEIQYQFEAGSNQFAVFSEIYYPKGWKAFIDGKETPIVKVNYCLRGLAVPAGKHGIEFRFEPQSFILGDRISLITGIISIISLLGGIAWLWKQNKKSITANA